RSQLGNQLARNVKVGIWTRDLLLFVPDPLADWPPLSLSFRNRCSIPIFTLRHAICRFLRFGRTDAPGRPTTGWTCHSAAVIGNCALASVSFHEDDILISVTF